MCRHVWLRTAVKLQDGTALSAVSSKICLIEKKTTVQIINSLNV